MVCFDKTEMFLSKFRSTVLGTVKIDAAVQPFCVAKFLSKKRVAGGWTAPHGFNQFAK